MLTVDSFSSLSCALQPFEEEMKKAKCTMESDGWQDARKRPLLNVCATTPAGTTFIKAVDTSGEIKVTANPEPAVYLCAHFLSSPNQLGC